MQEIQVTEIHQGIWIDKKRLQMAGLGDRLEIEMRENEIRIRTAHEISGQKIQASEKGWDIFEFLGNDAAEGCLKNASEDHDRYLYGKQK